jgi:hypothetical protein
MVFKIKIYRLSMRLYRIQMAMMGGGAYVDGLVLKELICINQNLSRDI